MMMATLFGELNLDPWSLLWHLHVELLMRAATLFGELNLDPWSLAWHLHVELLMRSFP
jgi:hypothetical protein